ncbi:histidine triad nucleotide-binding protein [Thermoproteota archaeon]
MNNAKGEIKAKTVFETDDIIAFHDIAPQAPTHILVIPKQHKESLLHFNKEDEQLLLNLNHAVQSVARQLELDKTGFRVVLNCGADAGQEVPHIHFHILAGRPFFWPPG